MPVPRATQVKGSSAIETGSPVVTLIASSRRWSKAPPPVSMMPLSTISAANSGGTTSSALFKAVMIWDNESDKASATCLSEITTSLGTVSYTHLRAHET